MGRVDISREKKPRSRGTARSFAEAVLFLDPGLDVGWAAKRSPNQPYEYGEVHVTDLWRFLENFYAAHGRKMILGLEDFDMRGGVDSTALTAPKCIGIIEEWARQRDIEIAVYQQPQVQSSPIFSDKRLAERGLLDKRQNHAMSALRHLMYFLEDFLPGNGRLRQA